MSKEEAIRNMREAFGHRDDVTYAPVSRRLIEHAATTGPVTLGLRSTTDGLVDIVVTRIMGGDETATPRPIRTDAPTMTRS